MLDAALGSVSRIAKAVADRACAIGCGMADFPCAIGRGMADVSCGVSGLCGGVFGVLFDTTLLRPGLVGISEGAGERQGQRGKQEQTAFHGWQSFKSIQAGSCGGGIKHPGGAVRQQHALAVLNGKAMQLVASP